MKKDIILKIVISIIIIAITIFALLGIINENNKMEDFQHKDTNELTYKLYEATEDDEVNMEFYKEGNYIATKLYFKNKTIVIEENIIDSYLDDGQLYDDGTTYKSILYSKQKLNKNYIYDYLYQMHNDAACGVEIRSYKKLAGNNNYYSVKFYVPDDC